MNEMNLSPKQKERLIFLLGPRYKNDNIMKIVVDMHEDYTQNLEKGIEMVKELYLEALRAPMN